MAGEFCVVASVCTGAVEIEYFNQWLVNHAEAKSFIWLSFGIHFFFPFAHPLSNLICQIEQSQEQQQQIQPFKRVLQRFCEMLVKR